MRGRIRLSTFLGASALVTALAACTSGGVPDTAVATGGRASRQHADPTPPSSASPAAPHRQSTRHRDPLPPAPWERPPRDPRGHLRPGSRPSALPGDLLIADKLNNRLLVVDPRGRIRWQFPRPGDLAPGQTFRIPDDAFFSPDGRYIIATEEDEAVISVIDVRTERIVYRYGKPGRPGSGPNRLSNPDDAMILPDGDILTADIKNCRLLLIAPHTHHPKRIFGQTMTGCWHDPPHHYGSPNGVFPTGHGRFLVTEINGDWVDSINLHGSVYWSTHPPGVAYPSDSSRIGPGQFLTVDYSTRGQAVIFDRRGRALWRYRGQLDHPSLALPLPDGNIVLNDDFNHRVVVIDRHTKKIIWQYGHTGVAGRRPGYLDNPDGLDLVPPYSLSRRG